MESLKKTMKAIVFNGPWDMTMETIPTPQPQEGEVLVQIEAVGICSSDVHGFSGESGRRTRGMVMGHEAAGVVIAHGPGVTAPQIGTRIVVYNIIANTAPEPDEGDPSFLNKKVIGVNLGTRGAMAEYLRVPATNALAIAPGLSPEIGLLAEPLGVATHGFRRLEEKNSLGKKLAIVGCGTIGLAAITYAGATGINDIVGIDVIPEKADKAVQFGAIPLVTESEEEDVQVAARVETALVNKPDIVVDAVGSRASIALCFELVKSEGAILLIGNIAKEAPFPLQDVVSNEITLTGTYGFDKAAFADSLRMIPDHQDKLSLFIEDHCTLEETPAMMTALAKGEKQALKVVINVNK